MVWNLYNFYSTNSCESNDAKSNSFESIPYIVESHQIHQEQTARKLLPTSEMLFDMMKNDESVQHLKNKYVHIGLNDYLIKKKIGDGAEGVIYLAETLTHKEVIIKMNIIHKANKSRKSYNNELYGLRKLGRLYDHDDYHLVIVGEKLNGISFDRFYDDYVEEHGNFFTLKSRGIYRLSIEYNTTNY